MIKQVTKASVGYVVAGLLLLLTSFNAVAEPDIFYFHNDHLGTPQVVTDQDQNIVWKANYTPFGEADIVVEDIEMNIRFPGQYYDKETGYHYNYYRTYDPTLGRYIQSDPIGLNGGLNTYGYVGGNPLGYSDPYGLDRDDIDSANSRNGYSPRYSAVPGNTETCVYIGATLSAVSMGLLPASAAFWLTVANGEIASRSTGGAKGLGNTGEFVLSGAGKNNFIYAEISKKGVIDFAIEAGEGASIRGGEMFKSMMTNYGSNVKGISGNWTYGTNLAKVNELTKGGMSLQKAISQTWTGNQAAKYGFSSARVTESVGSSGNYTTIRAVFE